MIEVDIPLRGGKKKNEYRNDAGKNTTVTEFWIRWDFRRML